MVSGQSWGHAVVAIRREVPDVVIGRLRRHAWPRNVRDLQDVIERAVIVTARDTSQIPADRRVHSPTSPDRTLAKWRHRVGCARLRNAQRERAGSRDPARPRGSKGDAVTASLA